MLRKEKEEKKKVVKKEKEEVKKSQEVWTRQADLLRPLAPILSIRDDTFTIRAYGDARDSQGHILARAVCEAVIRRTRDFVDTTEEADILTPPTRKANKTYGRQFQLLSFRWLAPSEV